MAEFVSRAGLKLEHALNEFGVDVDGFVCADLGCNVGGFVDCLLQRGASKVYAVDTGYGVLDWNLRKDPRVVVMERTNAMHVTLPERVRLVTIDVAWTKQSKILPSARRLVMDNGEVISLIKPHYEAPVAKLKGGVLPPDEVPAVVATAEAEATKFGFQPVATVKSPIKGAKGNIEYLCRLKPIL